MEITVARRPRIDPQAYLAYWFDHDQGYRGGGGHRWQLCRLHAPLPKRPWEHQQLSLETVLGDPSGAPKVRIEPIQNGKLRVTSPLRLVVRAYDESLPRLTDETAEVAYGSVVRAGPLLFAVLYAEQVESLGEGRFSLPFVGEAQNVQPDLVGHEQFLRPYRERSRALQLWKGVFAASFIITAAAAVALVLATGISFRYGDSVMDRVAACVSCVFIGWSALLAVGLPINRALLGWQYSGGEKSP